MQHRYLDHIDCEIFEYQIRRVQNKDSEICPTLHFGAILRYLLESVQFLLLIYVDVGR